VMVKPQFEVGRDRVGSGGVVRDPAAREDAVRGVVEVIEAEGGRILGTADSGLPGPKGNRETFVWCGGGGPPVADLDGAIRAAVEEDR
jgi:23S rRNA (cytidine1920-2'-O)/16S rRNA (cytidine1409-2'-O)-methyltransferase